MGFWQDLRELLDYYGIDADDEELDEDEPDDDYGPQGCDDFDGEAEDEE